VPARHDVRMAKGGQATCRFVVNVPGQAPAGEYPLFIRLCDEAGNTWGQIEERFSISEAIRLTAEGRSPRAGSPAQVQVHVSNVGDSAVAGEVSFVCPITAGLRPRRLSRTCTVGARSTKTLVFALDAVPETTRPYGVDIVLPDTQGRTVRKTEELHFMDVPKRRMPIKIDGDISDWDLKTLTPLPAFCEYNCGGRGGRVKGKAYRPGDPDNLWQGKADASLALYVTWDDRKLYWAARIVDDVQYSKGKRNKVWPYDCLHMALYPWSYSKAQRRNGSFYKDHCALDKDGVSTIDRCQSATPVPWGPKGRWPKDTEFVARKTKFGYVFECAYGLAALRPLMLRPGSKLRMAAMYFDVDSPSDRELGKSAVMWYSGVTNTEGQVDRFAELTLVE